MVFSTGWMCTCFKFASDHPDCITASTKACEKYRSFYGKYERLIALKHRTVFIKKKKNLFILNVNGSCLIRGNIHKKGVISKTTIKSLGTDF